jgi:hypothetical protein
MTKIGRAYIQKPFFLIVKTKKKSRECFEITTYSQIAKCVNSPIGSWELPVHRHRCRMEEIVNRREEEETRSSLWDEVTG